MPGVKTTLMTGLVIFGCTVFVGEGFGVGVGVKVGITAGISVAIGVGEGFASGLTTGEGVGDGFGFEAGTFTPFTHTNFFPDFRHTYT